MAPVPPPPPYRLQCIVHRESTSGIIIHDEQILGTSEAAAVADAKARFAHLLAGRSGSAALRDAAGRVVWSARPDTPPGAGAPRAAASGADAPDPGPP
ncbi:hypothetical protein [Methylobacterium sp. J-070]|uniref:hypothetical protein n=1 Tax=Methylobacterium sp. J-070 TaxID=2836650 RepID=UPI001FB90CFD|nr:hypothetical protein [Methylobacterium sp. J-070]MCJ2048662.1 hypothetical protein [Methylobacterium sp. J-070]